jgi:pimeloyl-ACP methyl ester carboxylesterase
MKQHRDGCIDWRIFGIASIVALACGCATMEGTNIAVPAAPPQTEYAPPGERGPIVILLSGVDGPDLYRSHAAEVARLGYYAILLDGKDIDIYSIKGYDGAGDLRRAIERAQRSPKALPGKAAVIGFSLGGGGALTHAAVMPDLVSAIVTYYPRTSHVTNMRNFVAQFRVPILVLAAERDDFMKCCMIETARAMEAAAKGGGKPFELVVYPNALHSFAVKGKYYRAEDAADAWQHTTKMLGQYQPLR